MKQLCCRSRGVRAGLLIGALLILLLATSGAGAAPDGIRPGEVIEAVPCKDYPGQSYALYLPSGYTPQKRWPIVYAFDPGAQGDSPVRLYREVAEKYGYILAGSNNSQNFLGAEEGKAIQSMLDDTHARLAIDPQRIYTTGFSGGARVATLVALRCTECKVAGVIASGATYPANIAPAEEDSFLYFMVMGDTDFNFPELVQTRLAKERYDSPYRVRLFPGPHQWAPAGVFEEAIQWFQLRAMRAGTIPKDEAFIKEQKNRTAADALQAEQAHDSLREFYAYKSLTEDFRGLADVPEAEPKLQAVRKSPELKKALDKERQEVESQRRLEDEAAANITRYFQNPLSFDSELRTSIVTNMQALRRDGQNSKDETQRRVHLRACNALFAEIVEEGQRRKAAGKFSEALPFFEMMAEAVPDRAWPPLLIAETRVAMRDNKRALKALRQAANTGRISAEILEKDGELAPLFSDPDFQKIVAELKKKPAPPR
ncbi:MAG: hypothetical protein WA463_10225 [Terriglobales bacterium]